MSTPDTQRAPGRPSPAGPARRIPAPVLWFAVLGGMVAWAAHELVAWSVMELTCISPLSSDLVDQHGGSPGTGAWTVAIVAVVLPWLVAVLATLTCLWVRRRMRSYSEGDEPVPDVLAGARTSFLMVLGLFLDLMAVAIITGGGIALLVLEPCG